MKKLLLLVLLSVASPVWSQTADTVLLNGKILTVDTQFSIQEAIALREGSAWFSFDENKRGSLEVGKLADLAVLSRDYMTVPVDQIGSIESLLTMVGGKIVYAAPPYQSR